MDHVICNGVMQGRLEINNISGPLWMLNNSSAKRRWLVGRRIGSRVHFLSTATRGHVNNAMPNKYVEGFISWHKFAHIMVIARQEAAREITELR